MLAHLATVTSVSARTQYPPPPVGTRPPGGPPGGGPPPGRPPNNPPGQELAGEACLTTTRATQHEGPLRVKGQKRCAAPNGTVRVTINSDPVVMPSFQALEDGSFSHDYCLPASVTPGDHTVVVDIVGRENEITRSLTVSQNDATACEGTRAADTGAGGGTSVLGTSERNPAAGGGGILPRTGGDLLRLLLYALVLVLFGSTLVVAARRRGLRLADLPLFRGSRTRAIAALPPPEVPFVDTSRFVPYRSKVAGARGSRPAPSDTTMGAWPPPNNEAPN